MGDACSVYWLVIQNSPLELQEKYLPLFKKAAQNGDIPLSNVAMMEDRINMFQGKPQKYGSQIVDGRLWKLQDESMVDQWRKQVGMEPLKDYLKHMNVKR